MLMEEKCCDVADGGVYLQVEEVKRHSHCLAFSSAGPQSQTYYISYDSYTEHLRWHRMASKVRSARSAPRSCRRARVAALVSPR